MEKQRAERKGNESAQLRRDCSLTMYPLLARAPLCFSQGVFFAKFLGRLRDPALFDTEPTLCQDLLATYGRLFCSLSQTVCLPA